jgi:hypothetical protein
MAGWENNMGQISDGPEATAYHEAGHCVSAYTFGGELSELTIRGQQCPGNTINWEGGNARIQTQLDAFNTLVVLCAGPLAELKFWGLLEAGFEPSDNQPLTPETVDELIRVFEILREDYELELRDPTYDGPCDYDSWYVRTKIGNHEFSYFLGPSGGDAVLCRHDDSAVIRTAMIHALEMVNDAVVWNAIHHVARELLGSPRQVSDTTILHCLEPAHIKTIIASACS